VARRSCQLADGSGNAKRCTGIWNIGPEGRRSWTTCLSLRTRRLGFGSLRARPGHRPTARSWNGATGHRKEVRKAMRGDEMTVGVIAGSAS